MKKGHPKKYTPPDMIGKSKIGKKRVNEIYLRIWSFLPRPMALSLFGTQQNIYLTMKSAQQRGLSAFHHKISLMVCAESKKAVTKSFARGLSRTGFPGRIDQEDHHSIRLAPHSKR